MKRWFWLMTLILTIVMSVGLIVACGDDDDDDDDDDDTFDDDDDNDDNADDDDDDDDDDVVGAPVIKDAAWDPPTLTEDATYGWLSYVVFHVCDEDDNLAGGAIYIYETGTLNLIWAAPMEWNSFPSGAPSVPDCSNEENLVGAGTQFQFNPGEEPPGYDLDYCVDLEVSDGDGNFSNKLTNICLYIP